MDHREESWRASPVPRPGSREALLPSACRPFRILRRVEESVTEADLAAKWRAVLARVQQEKDPEIAALNARFYSLLKEHGGVPNIGPEWPPCAIDQRSLG